MELDGITEIKIFTFMTDICSEAQIRYYSTFLDIEVYFKKIAGGMRGFGLYIS